MKICVIGLGYIGLPTAALLANKNYQVHGVDVNQYVVDTINRGEIHIYEPELDEYVSRAISSKKLVASTIPTESDVFIIAVPTPFHEGYKPNIDYVIAATKAIVPFVKTGNMIILESTSPVGTTEKIEETLRENNIDTSTLFIAHCPERVLPGKVMRELTENDRIIGGITDEATQKVVEFYESFVQGKCLKTNARTAEMCKLVENSSRDVQIAFANELSMICEKANINVWELINLANHHPRVNILTPGTGVGGHCIAVDPWFIVSDYPDEAKIIRAAREINNFKTEWVIEKIKNAALKFELENGRKPKIAALGLAFKPNIDDLRESPAIEVVHELLKDNFDVVAIEPHIKNHPKFTLDTLENVNATCDIVAYLVGHTAFKKFKTNKISFDFCGITNN